MVLIKKSLDKKVLPKRKLTSDGCNTSKTFTGM